MIATTDTVTQIPPISGALLTALQPTIQQLVPESTTTSSKGKMFSKDAPQINAAPSITPITLPAAGEQAIDLIALIAAMMTVVQAMELIISEFASKVTGAEASLQTDATKANMYAEKQAIAKQQEAEEKAREAASRDAIMKIFGYIAAALTCVVSLGTLSAVAAFLIVAITVVDQLGYLQKGVDSLLSSCGVDPDSVLGKILSVIIKVIIIIAATKGAGAAQEGAEAMSSTAKVVEEAGIEMTEMGAEATEVAPETTESTEEATTTSKATLAGKLAGTNAFASLNPIGDFAIFISRVTGATKKGDGNEAWIDMATGIATSLLSMAAMFSAVKGAANSATAIGKAVDDPAVMTKMTNQINNLILAMNAVSAGLGINVGVLKIEQGQKELELGKLKAVATEIKALTDFFQSLVQDEQKWVKQNNEMDKQLSQSFEYDEFANFSQVSLHA